jgi:hypothetical protein
MGKSPTHLKWPCVDVNHFKKVKDQPLAVCEVRLNYLHIYVHSHYQKE